MLREALTYPFAGERPGRRLLGTAVVVASMLFVVTVPIYVGYLVRLLRGVAYGDAAPPPNTDIGGMFVEGLTAFGLVFAYAALPLAPFVYVTLPFVDVTLGTPGLTALAVVSLLLAYLLPAVVASYAADASVVGGLAGWRIVRVLGSTRYLVAWLPAVAIATPALASVWVLGQFGVAPVLVVGPPVVLYGTLVGGYLVARGVADAVELARRPVVRSHGPAG